MRTRDPLQLMLGSLRDAIGIAREFSCDRLVHLALLLALFETARTHTNKPDACIAQLAARTGTSPEVARHAIRSLRMHGLVAVSERSARTEFFMLSPNAQARLTACLDRWAEAMEIGEESGQDVSPNQLPARIRGKNRNAPQDSG